MQPEAINTVGELPVYFQALLNIIAFLIAAVAVWYAYFIKGKTSTDSGAGEYPWLNQKFFRKLGEDINRLANVAERIYEVLKHESDEAEIQRRVEEQLRRERKEQ